MHISTIRLWYTKIFIICLLGISLYTMSQSLSDAISNFSKNLWGHKFLISSFIDLKLAMGDRVFPQALVGKDGWLEFTQNNSLNSYQNGTVLSEEALQKTGKMIAILYDRLRKKNITLLLVIVPNKATIYPDKLPDGLPRIHPQSQLDAFTAYMKKNGPPILVDVRPALIAGRKQQHDLYYKTDTHWNAYGAFIAYTEIMKQLAKTDAQLAPKNIADFKIKASEPFLHDIPEIMGANFLEPRTLVSSSNESAHFLTINNDPAVPLQISISSNKNLPELLMYMDSFGSSLQEWIAPHFSKSTFVLNHSDYVDSQTEKMIDATKPNIIIIEFVERYFEQKQLDKLLTQLTQN